MTTKHLAGPWSIGFQPVPFTELVGSEGGWVELNSPEHLGFALFVWRMEDDERSPELEATVRAACAAPELLAELEYAHEIIGALLNLVPDDQKYEMTIRLARIHDGEGAVRTHERCAAIARAKGEQV